MAVYNYKWRNIQTNAAAYFYVDSFTGSDLTGDGSINNPFKTLSRAYYGRANQQYIICRGIFSENLAAGNHNCTIQGDYYGAAVFDGNEKYTIYGFMCKDLIIRNCPVITDDTLVFVGPASLAGAGRAATASAVGNPTQVYGVYAPRVLIENSPVYFGAIGGMGSVTDYYVAYVGFCKLKASQDAPFWFQNSATSGEQLTAIRHITVFDVPKNKRIATRYPNKVAFLTSSLFAKTCFRHDDNITFTNCLFTGDTTFDINGTEFMPTGTTSAERQQSIFSAISAAGLTTKLVFNDCVFVSDTYDQVFNDADNGDYTLKLDGPGVTETGYYGAFAPALNIPIMSNSDETPSTWDENSATGMLSVVNDEIVADSTSNAGLGEIYTKVITIRPDLYSINGIISNFGMQFANMKLHMNNKNYVGEEFVAGDTLPVGRYILQGEAQYNGSNYFDGNVIAVTTTGTTFTDESQTQDSLLIAIEDVNAMDVCYVRSTPTAYVKIKSALIDANNALQTGGVYLNMGNKNITYRNKTIVPGESFVAQNNVDAFECPTDANYEIGIMFDDTRVPSSDWIPAQLWGEYFASKQNGALMYETGHTDEPDYILSSGNPLSFIPNGNQTYQGGYLNNIKKTILTNRYLQFKLVVKKEPTYVHPNSGV